MKRRFSPSPPSAIAGGPALLLGDVLRQLEDLGVKNVSLEVAAENTAALTLYRGHGFRTVGARAGYYRSLGDRATDAWIMRRDLHRPLT